MTIAQPFSATGGSDEAGDLILAMDRYSIYACGWGQRSLHLESKKTPAG